MSDDLVVWLRAQLDEDERLASLARDGLLGQVVLAGARQNGKTTAFAFLERFDPARVIREVAAKRAILDEVERELADDSTNESAKWLAEVVASVYADRPGYRDEWSPGSADTRT